MAADEKYPLVPDLTKTVAALTARIEKLERGGNPNTTVFYNSSGDVLLRAGTDPNSGNKVFSVGRDNDGKAALAVSPAEVGSGQSIKIYDRSGQVIVGDSQTYQSGLRRPSISHSIIHNTQTWPAQTSTSYATQAEAYFRKSNPTIEVIYNYFSSDGATGVSVRFVEIETGTHLAPRYDQSGNYEIFHNPAPAVLTRNQTAPLELANGLFNVGDPIHLAVQAYRPVGFGTGTFVVQVVAIRGADDL